MKYFLAVLLVALVPRSQAVELELTVGVSASSPSPVVLNITGPLVPAGCAFATSAAGITLIPGTNRLAASGEFNAICQPSMVVEVLSGPAVVRVGQPVVLTWQFNGTGFCTSGSGADASSFPAAVSGWPTSSAYPGTTICGPGACGQTAPVFRSVTVGMAGLHRFRLVCYPRSDSNLYFVQSYNVVATQ